VLVGGNGGLNTCVAPLQLLVTVSVPVEGGVEYVIVPVREYEFVAGLQAPGTAVSPVMVQRMLQFVEPVPAVCEAEMLVGCPE